MKVDEIPDFARIFADRLELEMFDVHGREAFFVFNLHAVENAAIGVDANKELPGRFEIAQHLGWITHNIYPEIRGSIRFRVKHDVCSRQRMGGLAAANTVGAHPSGMLICKS